MQEMEELEVCGSKGADVKGLDLDCMSAFFFVEEKEGIG